MTSRILLWIDACVNLALGALLVFFPRDLMQFLGVPIPDSAFYASILGAVLFGIGIALILETNQKGKTGGLGLHGAIAINFCGALCLVGWLIFGGLNLDTRGLVLLWAIAIVVLVIGIIEIAFICQKNNTVK